MIELKDLLTKDIREILESPELSKSIISYYSKLYAGGQLVRGCNSSKQNYFRRLQIDGLQTQKRIEMSKYQLNKDAVIQFGGQIYNSSTMTDEIAEQILEKFPKLIKAFVQPKVGAIKELTEKEKSIAKALELGIEKPEKLSAKKLKEAIADAELLKQESDKKEREELVLKAIELGIENAESMPDEFLLRAIEENAK